MKPSTFAAFMLSALVFGAAGFASEVPRGRGGGAKGATGATGATGPSGVTNVESPLHNDGGIVAMTAASASTAGYLTRSGGVLAIDAGVMSVTSLAYPIAMTGIASGLQGLCLFGGTPPASCTVGLNYSNASNIVSLGLNAGTTVAMQGPVTSTGAFTSSIASGSVGLQLGTGTKGCFVAGGNACWSANATYISNDYPIRSSDGFFLAARFASFTAPTIGSGFGTSPSIASSNGTVAFRINVGTGGSASSGVIALPTVATGWNCFCNDLTTANATVFLCKQTASSTTSATIGNFDAAGAAAAWVASDIVAVNCVGH